MNEIFVKLANMSVAAGWLILAVLALRLLLKKAPRWITCLLWALVAVSGGRSRRRAGIGTGGVFPIRPRRRR